MASFKKAGRSKVAQPRGTKPSLHNSQLLISSGTPSLDALLGGLAIGSVLLVEEDSYNLYANFLVKYFLAEGVMCGHALLVSGPSVHTADILKELPASVAGEIPVPKSSTAEPGLQTTMDIAWRYQKLPAVKSGFSHHFGGHFYDLSKTMDQSHVHQVPVSVFDASQQHFCDNSLHKLSGKVNEVIDAGNFNTSTTPLSERNVLRIVISSLGSPMWSNEHNDPILLSQFLHRLRASVRGAYAAAVVTLPSHLLQDEVLVRRLERHCDAAVALESFSGSDKEGNPLYRDYHGLFHIRKLPCLNCLVPHYPETLELGFKLYRKKFAIEKLHLPPELSDTVSRAQEDATVKAKNAIAVKPTKHPNRYNIDF